MVRYGPTMVAMGDGELRFDSWEGTWEIATTSKEGSRHENYPIPTRGGMVGFRNGFWGWILEWARWSATRWVTDCLFFFAKTACALSWVCVGFMTFTLKKLECSKQAIAWIHEHGIMEQDFWSYFIGFWDQSND